MNKKHTFEQSQQIMMFEYEKVLEVAVQTMSENDKALYMGLCNIHTTDGTGPLINNGDHEDKWIWRQQVIRRW